MDFKQLVSFTEVVNLKSFSKASKKLYLTQPTITCHIQNLEEELGVLLVDRSNREITPTDSGSIFYNYAQEMINLKNTATHHLNSHSSKIKGNIEINSSSIPSQYIIPYFIKEFNNLYSDVNFKIKQTNSKKIYDLIKEGCINFGIVGAKYNTDKNIEYIPLTEDQLVLALNCSYKDKFSPYDTISLEDFLNLPLILREEGSGSRYLIETELSKLDIPFDKLNIVAEVSNNDAIKNMIKLNIGTSFISELAIKEEIKSGSIIPVKVEKITLNRNFYFIYHKKRYLSPLHNTFKNFILDSLKN